MSCVLYQIVESNVSFGVLSQRLFLQCEAPKIAKLVNINPITMVYGTQITIVTGANPINKHHWGASHCRNPGWISRISLALGDWSSTSFIRRGLQARPQGSRGVTPEGDVSGLYTIHGDISYKTIYLYKSMYHHSNFIALYFTLLYHITLYLFIL